MKLSLLTIVSAFALSSYAQVPSIQWQKAFGGSNHEYSKQIKNKSEEPVLEKKKTRQNSEEDYAHIFKLKSDSS